MKQGQATSSGSGSTKQEPQAKAVNVPGVSQLGAMVGRMAAVEPLYEGRGLEAPMAGSEIHPCGSQGRHR